MKVFTRKFSAVIHWSDPVTRMVPFPEQGTNTPGALYSGGVRHVPEVVVDGRRLTDTEVDVLRMAVSHLLSDLETGLATDVAGQAAVTPVIDQLRALVRAWSGQGPG